MSAPQRVVSLWDMLTVNGNWFVSVMSYVGRLDGAFQMAQGTTRLNEQSRKAIRTTAVTLRETLLAVEVPATLAAVDEVIALSAPESDASMKKVGEWLGQVASRLEAELKGRHLFILTPVENRLFSRVPKEQIDKAFPLATEDLTEASKCLGLGRYTASVFHLMRAMECAVQELSSALAIANPDREWGKLLSDIEARIKTMPKGSKKDEWSESHAHLYHVKQAWRNKTMHPKKTYTQEESESVFAAVQSFMEHLAPLIA